MSILSIFPRKPDGKRPAWTHLNNPPVEPWERFSPAYEAQAERLIRALESRGLGVTIDGAGGQDGEYVTAHRNGEYVFFTHLEDPEDAPRIAAMDDAALAEWIDAEINGEND